MAAIQSPPGLQMQMLGSLSLRRGGASVALPKSRKVRALLAYLTLATQPVTRSKLSQLLWDSASDPRGELRWCMSRLRTVVDEPGRRRLIVQDEDILLDWCDAEVDVLMVRAALHRGSLHQLELAELQQIAASFGGELLDGLSIDAAPLWQQWLMTERRRVQGTHITVLSEIVSRLPAAAQERLTFLGQWLQLDAFESKAHELLLSTLVGCGRIREAEEHLAATVRLFENESLDGTSIHEAFRNANNRSPLPSLRIDVVADTSRREQSPASVAHRASICVMPCLAATEQVAEARAYLPRIAAIEPGYKVHDLLTAFRLSTEVQGLFRTAARSLE